MKQTSEQGKVLVGHSDSATCEAELRPSPGESLLDHH